MNKQIKTLLLSAFIFAQAQATHAVPVTYSVSGTTSEWGTGREISISGSLVIDDQSIATGITPAGYTQNRSWNVLSGALSSEDFDLDEITGSFRLFAGMQGQIFDFFWRLDGTGISFLNCCGGGSGFYDADGSALNYGDGAIDNDYSLLAPRIQFGQLEALEPGSPHGQRVYLGGQLWLSQVPIPPAVWLFGSALGLMGVLRRKIIS